MTRQLVGRLAAAVALVCGLVVVAAPAASAADCKSSPTPDVPGTGLTGFFDKPPDPLPPEEDPFASGSESTIYQQYGYAGLRWHTYDLGCGPDAARHPTAVVGTALSNWGMNLPLTFAALTSSVTDVAFNPTFLGTFDPLIGTVSSTLYLHLFTQWVPLILTLLGLLLLMKARRANLASSTAAIGWAALVLVLAAALFRWPVHAGQFADDTVTTSLGGVVRALNGTSDDVSPGTAVSSSVHESVLYRNWLVGELGSADSATAREYGPELFDAQALTWREAAILENDPARGKRIIEAKRDRFGDIADEIRTSDPAAYEHLTGKRSDTRVGYAMLSTLAIFLALPFLLVSSLLLLGSFLIVRLAVMLFPALAILGLFPPARGILLGTFRVVGAALVNAMIFGVGAAVTVAGIGIILDPTSRLPGWLAVVLLPLFTFMMWFALKPFRSLTAMTHANADPFGEAAGSFGNAGRKAGSLAKRAGVAAAASFAGNAAAIAAARRGNKNDENPDDEAEGGEETPDRAEAKPIAPVAPQPTQPARTVQPTAVAAAPTAPRGELPPAPATTQDEPPSSTPNHPSAPEPTPAEPTASTTASAPAAGTAGEESGEGGSAPVFAPLKSESAGPPEPTEPEWFDGEQVHTIYRPDTDRESGENSGA